MTQRPLGNLLKQIKCPTTHTYLYYTKQLFSTCEAFGRPCKNFHLTAISRASRIPAYRLSGKAPEACGSSYFFPQQKEGSDLVHIRLAHVQRVSPYHIASLDTLRSATIHSCTLPRAPPRLRASLESLTVTLVEDNIVNFYKASRNSLEALLLGGPLCTVLTKTLYAYPLRSWPS